METEVTEFSNTLTRITAGGTGADVIDKLNTPLSQVEEHLNTLSQRINGLSNKSAVIRRYVPMSSDVFVGALVYFNSDSMHSRFEPALAALKTEPGKQGESIEADSARVEGMVIALDSEEAGTTTILGTMLCGGYWESTDAMHGCIGTDIDKPGAYFLSPTNAGHAVQDTNGHLRQPVFTNYGGGKFNMGCAYLAHDNHYHASCELGDNWVSVTDAPDGVTIPENSYWYYNGSADSSFTNLGELSDQITAIFYKGALQARTAKTFIISGGYLWCTELQAPAKNSIVVFNHYPFAYNGAVVRAVQSSNDALTVSNVNGTVTLTPNDFVNGTQTNAARAVTSINSNTINYTPVISGLSAGPGIDVELASTGVATISSSSQIGVPIDAYNVNHLQTNMTSDGYYLYFTFPKGRQSALVMSQPVTDVDEDTQLKAYAWAIAASGSAQFDVSYYWVPLKDSGSSISLSHSAQATARLVGATSSGGAAYNEATSGINITGRGMLYARLEILGAPNTDVKLLRLGFKLEVVSATTASTHVSSITNITAMINNAVAGASIKKYSCVTMSNAKLVTCSNTVEAYSNECIGVALAAASADTNCSYVYSGTITDSNFNFIAGNAIYIGLNGTLTQENPANDSNALFIQRVGTAISATTIQINIEPGVIKSKN